MLPITGHEMSQSKLIPRHLLAGLICGGIIWVLMSVVIVGILVLGGSGNILIHRSPLDNMVSAAPGAGERILIMAYWISVGGSMVGTFMGFGRRNPQKALGYFSSLILAPLAGLIFGAVQYGLYLYLRLPVYDGDPSSVWLPLGVGILFGAIAWGNILGWFSADC